MTSNPIRGPATNSPTRTNPDPTKGAPTEHRKIEKVEDVDAEEQSKRRKFNAFFKEEPTEETPAIKLPSPLEIVELANKEKKEGSTHLERGNEQTNQTTKKELPQSDRFWQQVGEEPIDPSFVEMTTKETTDKGAKEERLSSYLHIPIHRGSKKNIDQPTPTSPSTQLDKGIKNPLPTHSVAKEPLQQESPTPRPILTDETQTISGRFLEQDEMKAISTEEPKKKGKKEFQPEDKTPPLASFISQEFQETSDREKRDKKEPVEIVVPSAQPLPLQAAQSAQAATIKTIDRLRPEISPLFYQMVGTIHMIQSSSGITQTEVILNNPAFADSKFYGASIVIEKYATAPDSFNIRLTGSNEAVAAFQQNIPNLFAAFQKGNFSFKIGRIEAEYSHEKPLFKRKEKNDTDLGSDSSDKQR